MRTYRGQIAIRSCFEYEVCKRSPRTVKLLPSQRTLIYLRIYLLSTYLFAIFICYIYLFNKLFIFNYLFVHVVSYVIFYLITYLFTYIFTYLCTSESNSLSLDEVYLTFPVNHASFDCSFVFKLHLTESA